MEAAHENVGRKLAGLQKDAQQARQKEITLELLDLITGSDTMIAR
jgi:F0F1-type ATP synthase gamma subunit